MTLPIEARYDVTEVADVAVSPAGNRVAFVAAEMDPAADERRSSVFVVPADGSREPHRLTRVDDASNPTWSPDGTRLAVTMARDEDVALRVGRDDDDGDTDDADHASDGDTDDGESDGDDGESDGDDGESDGDEGESESESDEEDADEGDGEDDGDDGPGGDEPTSQVWVFDLERGGDARQVTRFDEGVESFDWSPDGDRLVVASRDPTDDQREYLDDLEDGGPIVTERLQHKYDGAGYLDTVRTYLYVVDVATRETERLDCTGLPPSAGTAIVGRSPAWGHRGIAFCGYDGEDGEEGGDGGADEDGVDADDTTVLDVFVCDPAADERERLTDGSLRCERLEWSPSGQRLAFVGSDPENAYRPTEVYVAHLGTPDDDTETPGGVDLGAVADATVRTVSGALDRTVWYSPARWLDDQRLLAAIGDEGWTRLARLDADGEPERVFDRQPRSETVLGFDTGGGRVAVVRSAHGDGTDLYCLSASELDADASATDPRTRLTALNDDLFEEFDELGSRRVSFEGANGDEVEAIGVYPPTFDPADPDPRPFVLSIHGGPMAYDQPRWTFKDQLFTDRGYVVLKVNYHGSSSYGRAFCESLKGSWNTLEVEDLLAATDWAVDAGWADPDRLFVTGFSQGGVNTAYVLTRTDRFAAAAAEHGVYDLRATFGTDDSHNWFEADMGLPWENPEAYDDGSSIPDVDHISTPLLVTAGDEDRRCPPSQAEQLYVSVRKQGVPAKLVLYQGEHHAVTAPERAVHRLRTILEWFDEHDPTTD